MAPSLPLMAFELDSLSSKDASVFDMQPLSHHETIHSKILEDLEVDITELSKPSEVIMAQVEDPDATEYSSSFADTVSGTGNCSGLSEAEVESEFCGNNDVTSSFDALGSMFHLRKKRLTSHWRSFVRPLMWRCKWAELRIKEIESQASKYSRELAAYHQSKHSGLDQFSIESVDSKSLPFSGQNNRKMIMRRRKRKRLEVITDMSSYMLHHNLFSYLETKRSDLDGTSMADEFCNPVVTDHNANSNDDIGFNDDLSLFELGDGDTLLEQVIWKIEMVQSRVHKLKSQLDLIISKNAARFSSSENLSLLAACDAQTSSAHSPTISAGNGELMSVGGIFTSIHHISEYDIGEMVMPESGISSYGEAVPVPDIIESTVGLLSASGVTLLQPQIGVGDLCEHILENVLIHNETADEESHFNSTSNQRPEKPQELERGEEITNHSMFPASDSDTLQKTVAPQEPSNLKSCLASDFHIPRNKRKRGERKAGSGSWNKKCSGEPDSQ